MEELSVNPTGVFCMEALVSNKNRSIVKSKVTVNVDLMAIKEVKDLGDDKGIGETKTNEGGMAEEGGVDRGTVGILNIL
jgi:hypothetical protein